MFFRPVRRDVDPHLWSFKRESARDSLDVQRFGAQQSTGSFRTFRYRHSGYAQPLRASLTEPPTASGIPPHLRDDAAVVASIERGGVWVNGARIHEPGHPIVHGDSVALCCPDVPLVTPTWDESRVLFDDGRVLVVDKAAGVLTASTPYADRGTLHAAVSAARGGAVAAADTQVDAEATGGVAFVRSFRLQAAFAALMARRAVTKVFVAVLDGAWRFDTDVAIVDAPLSFDSTVSRAYSHGALPSSAGTALALRDAAFAAPPVSGAAGGGALQRPAPSPLVAKPEQTQLLPGAAARGGGGATAVPAHTAFVLLGEYRGSDGAPRSVVEVCGVSASVPHQVRAHAAHVGLPICGDVAYGARPAEGGGGIKLHCGWTHWTATGGLAARSILAPLPDAEWRAHEPEGADVAQAALRAGPPRMRGFREAFEFAPTASDTAREVAAMGRSAPEVRRRMPRAVKLAGGQAVEEWHEREWMERSVVTRDAAVAEL